MIVRMLLSCFYWLFRHLLGLVVLRCRSDAANEVEILVLRHKLRVLRRQVTQPSCRPADRMFLAASRLRARVRRHRKGIGAQPRAASLEVCEKSSLAERKVRWCDHWRCHQHRAGACHRIPRGGRRRGTQCHGESTQRLAELRAAVEKFPSHAVLKRAWGESRRSVGGNRIWRPRAGRCRQLRRFR